MTLIALLQIYPSLLYTLVTIIGLCVGSFLNVVIYRLPIMLDRQWQTDCIEYLKLPVEAGTSKAKLSLLQPRSHCPQCQSPLKAWYNIPLLSYIFLKGKCAYCSCKIPWRYPAIELATAILSVLVVYQLGVSWQVLFALTFTWSLLSVAMIDIDTQLIPDILSLPLLWLGLALSISGLFSNSHDAIIGALAGYLSLWIFVKLFKLITGKTGMGHGDFKLFAAFGAWLGWQLLPLILFFSAIIGAVVSIIILFYRGQNRNTPIPFGPYLCLTAWLALFWGHDAIHYYLTISGLIAY